jgi:hypothetical protein
MKHWPILLIIVAVIFYSCKKSKVTYSSTAYINGPDFTVGPECHGLYFISLQNPTAYYTFDTLPLYSGIDLTTITATNPVHIKLNWHYADGCNKIVIDDVARIK